MYKLNNTKYIEDHKIRKYYLFPIDKTFNANSTFITTHMIDYKKYNIKNNNNIIDTNIRLSKLPHRRQIYLDLIKKNNII